LPNLATPLGATHSQGHLSPARRGLAAGLAAGLPEKADHLRERGPAQADRVL